MLGDVVILVRDTLTVFRRLFTLVAIVVILRLCGEELGIRALIPHGEGEAGDGRDSSLSRLVAVALLPFLGLYSACGLVDQQAGRLANDQFFRDGAFVPG
ncbi:MAG: hypothetical protein ACRYG2_16570 [Janthinobacterium lividum]